MPAALPSVRVVVPLSALSKWIIDAQIPYPETQGGNILSENYGAVRYVIPKAYCEPKPSVVSHDLAHLLISSPSLIVSSQGPVGSMNDFEGDDAVFNGPRSRLGSSVFIR